MLIHEVLKWELDTLERARPYRANEIPHQHLRLQRINKGRVWGNGSSRRTLTVVAFLGKLSKIMVSESLTLFLLVEWERASCFPNFSLHQYLGSSDFNALRGGFSSLALSGLGHGLSLLLLNEGFKVVLSHLQGHLLCNKWKKNRTSNNNKENT